jgi:1-acyl-sn-glycerol-3-phosphate acyltransferase
MITFLRQILFNVTFYGATFLFCIILTPMMILPRHIFMIGLNGYFKSVHLIEKYILGLDFEVRGKENIPKSGSFILAAKHYSAYETMKIHLLVNDPAIIMKKELSYIPLWGWLAMKGRMIFIDRGSRDAAINSIVAGARRIEKEGRPLAIFPQGTRVALDDTPQDKPYKGGIIRMYEATSQPILPLAMNSGIFWKKNAFFKYPGKVIFEFLDPIPPGLSGADALAKLQIALEDSSNKLVTEELERQKNHE